MTYFKTVHSTSTLSDKVRDLTHSYDTSLHSNRTLIKCKATTQICHQKFDSMTKWTNTGQSLSVGVTTANPTGVASLLYGSNLLTHCNSVEKVMCSSPLSAASAKFIKSYYLEQHNELITCKHVQFSHNIEVLYMERPAGHVSPVAKW